MKGRFYAIGILSFLGLFGAGMLVYQNYNSPVYQAKNYSSLYSEIGRSDVAALYYKLMRENKFGVIDGKEMERVRKEVFELSALKGTASDLYWEHLGPNYVGGRTRAIVRDNQPGNESILYAGAVAGGVFISYNGGEEWFDYNYDLENINIGDIGQTADGKLFVGTGPGHDGNGSGVGQLGSQQIPGNGLYRRDVDGTGNISYVKVLTPSGSGTSGGEREINRVISHPTDANKLYVGTGSGLRVSANAGAAAAEVAFFNPIDFGGGIKYQGSVDDIAITNDGSTIYVVGGSNIYKLSDAGGSQVTYVKTISLPAGNRSISRIAIALAPSDNNVLYAAAGAPGVASSTGNANQGDCTYGIFQSKDGGDTWNLIGPGGGSFDPYISANCQGGWDNTIAVFPNDAGRIIVGGVSLYGWDESKTAPGTGGWRLMASNFANGITDTNAVHSDKHRILFTDSNTIYITSDGGIGKSLDGGRTWGQNNNGYDVTQFYSVAAAFGVTNDSLQFTTEQVVGGTQDNGTQLIGLNPFLPSRPTMIMGGDGFDVAISNLANLAFSTVYHGSISRISNNGSGGSFFDAELGKICPNCGPFHTRINYWETPYYDKTKDSVLFFVKGNGYKKDSAIYYNSKLGEIFLSWPAPKDLVAGDSLMLPDFAQSKFVFAAASSYGAPANLIYMTRDAANLNEINPKWDLIANSSNSYPDKISEVFCMTFSADGNQLFLGSMNGNVYRIDNLNEGYDSLTLDIRSSLCVLTCTQINSPGAFNSGGSSSDYISSIAVDPNNSGNLIVTKPGYGGTKKVFRVTGADTCLSGNASVLSITGDLPSGLPVFSSVIAVHDKNSVVIGTEFGIYASENAFSGSLVNWHTANGHPRTPVYALYQQTKKLLYGENQPFNAENAHYRAIYSGSHGRGFYKTTSLVGLEEKEGKKAVGTKIAPIQFKVYPNPMSNVGFMEISVNENQTADIEIYNLNGKLVSVVKSGMMTAGKNKIRFNVDNFTSGTYIATLRTGGEMKVAKFVVMK